MKVGKIVEPNQKGQIVIPKDMRKTLGINANVPLNLVLRGKGIYIYPIKEVIGTFETESSYLKILEKTRGAWKEDGWKESMRKRRKIELEASKRRKQAW